MNRHPVTQNRLPLCPQEPTFKSELPLFRQLYPQTLRMAVRFDIRCRDSFCCYTAPMTYNAIECLVEDFGWDAVMDVLMKEAATASDERLDEVEARRIFDFRVL